MTDKNPYAKDLFEAEQSNLLDDLYDIPQRSCDRKVSNICCKETRISMSIPAQQWTHQAIHLILSPE